MQAAQIILLVFLILIGIILFVVLIVELTNIPQPLIVPFVDGTIIKIKSLSNNLYFKPIACSSITSCDNEFIKPFCDAFSNESIISAIGERDDPLTNWQLCQYSSLSDTGEAKYLIFSESNDNPFIMSFDNDKLIFTSTNNKVCTQFKSDPLICNAGDSQLYFSFILAEKNDDGQNTTSGAYNMITSCGIAENLGYVFSDGQGAISLPADICPPLILGQANAGIKAGCKNINDNPTCVLNYLFEIEVQS